LIDVMAQFFGQVGIGQAITIGHGEMFRFAEVFAGGLGNAAASHVFFAGVSQGHFPIKFHARFVDGHLVGFEIDGAVIVMQVKIVEIVFHRPGLESKAEHEPAETVFGVNLHDMPENWMFANGHHGFRAELGLFLDACAEAATQNEDGNVHCVHDPMLAKYEVQRKPELARKNFPGASQGASNREKQVSGWWGLNFR
jgi:hypothetical protein